MYETKFIMSVNLYLSYIPSFITKQHLYSMCKNLNLFYPGNIVLKYQKNNFNTAYIFVKQWYNGEDSKHMKKIIEHGENAYLLFAFPIYIKCSLLQKNEVLHV